ncbi:unnamed protein product [Clonostachys solani]|uniref:Uncharacterized protein n=1 Tax=Clonostachys solani TaxID=160281 RepID=A0A9N9ZI54_9HYPO|nr:unnamed protein product [Clonostachys solani]
MDNSSLFHAVLLSLGFKAYMVGAREYGKESSRYAGLTHCLNIAMIHNVRHAVDVYFGAKVPVMPLKLSHNQVQQHLRPGQMHAPYGSIYEHRIDDQASWIAQYGVPNFELLLEDIRVLNFTPSRSSSSLVCVRLTQQDECYSSSQPSHDHQAVGHDHGVETKTVGAIDEALFRKGGQKKWERTLKDEDERAEILSQYFEIHLTRAEPRAIKGTAADISEHRSSVSREMGF